MGTFKDHFSTVSTDYARYRPSYPSPLVERLAANAPDTRAAWDVATGSGQAAVALAARFDHVVATDASAAQLAEAERHPRVEYRVEPAERSSLSDGSVSLVTVAQALHWFDFEPFFAEVKRVCRPGGLFAAWTYGLARVHLPTGADDVLRLTARFYLETVGPYWPPERRHVEDGYATIPFPLEPVDLGELSMEAAWTLADFLGYLGTWSAVKRYRDVVGEDPVPALGEELAPLFGDETTKYRIEWPLRVLSGRVAG